MGAKVVMWYRRPTAHEDIFPAPDGSTCPGQSSRTTTSPSVIGETSVWATNLARLEHDEIIFDELLDGESPNCSSCARRPTGALIARTHRRRFEGGCRFRRSRQGCCQGAAQSEYR